MDANQSLWNCLLFPLFDCRPHNYSIDFPIYIRNLFDLYVVEQKRQFEMCETNWLENHFKWSVVVSLTWFCGRSRGIHYTSTLRKSCWNWYAELPINCSLRTTQLPNGRRAVNRQFWIISGAELWCCSHLNFNTLRIHLNSSTIACVNNFKGNQRRTNKTKSKKKPKKN